MMASLLARHAFRTVRRTGSAHIPRNIHTTPVALKKKGKAVIEDLFSEEDAFAEEDLIKIEDVSKSANTSTPAGTSEAAQPDASELEKATPAPAKVHKVKLDPTVRQQRFEEQFSYVELRIGRSPSIQKERVRKRHFLTLLELAQSESDVRRVVELIPQFKDAGGELMDSFAEAFARRCQELQCQNIALDVFGNFAKYQVHLDINAARWLIHSLYLKYPLEQVLLATALYPAYNLPPPNKDLATASMLAAAFYKHGAPESIKAAEALKPIIGAMISRVDLATAPDHATRKHNKWISWALRRVNDAKDGKTPFIPQQRLPLKIELRKAQPPSTTPKSSAKPSGKPNAKPAAKPAASKPLKAKKAPLKA